MTDTHHEDDGRIERAIDGFFTLFNGRGFIVAAFYAIASAMFSVVGWKIALLSGIVYVAHTAWLGRCSIERFGVLFLGIATAYWIDIVPLQEWSHAAAARITALLAR